MGMAFRRPWGLRFQDGSSTLSTMESNFNVSPAEAKQSLTEVAVDQTATRAAAAPPKWALVLLAIGWGCIYVLPAIPDQTGHLRLLLFCLLGCIDSGLSLLWQKRRRVLLGRGGTFTPLRPAVIVPILIVVAFVVVLVVFVAASLFPGAHNLLPWWFYVGLGIAMGFLMYVGIRWFWRDWYRTPATRENPQR